MKTASGFEFDLDKSRLDNMEVLDIFADLEEKPEDFMLLRKLVVLLLGKDTVKKLYDHIRDESGRVPVEKFAREVTGIFQAFGEDAKK